MNCCQDIVGTTGAGSATKEEGPICNDVPLPQVLHKILLGSGALCDMLQPSGKGKAGATRRYLRLDITDKDADNFNNMQKLLLVWFLRCFALWHKVVLLETAQRRVQRSRLCCNCWKVWP